MTINELLTAATDALSNRDEVRFRELEEMVLESETATVTDRATLLALLDKMATAAELLCELGE